MNENQKIALDQAKQEHKEKVISEYELTDEDKELIEEALKEAQMPVKLTDDDFKLGAGELDIRQLNSKNFKQMLFRMLVLNNVYLRQVNQSLVDMMRLQMLSLKRAGVEDIVKETEDLLDELANKVKKDLNKAN